MKFKDLRPGDLIIYRNYFSNAIVNRIEMILSTDHSNVDEFRVQWFTVFTVDTLSSNEKIIDLSYHDDEATLTALCDIFRDGDQIH